MKRLVGVFCVVAALCALLAVPAAAAKPVEVSGLSYDDKTILIELRPIGKGEDEHYCLVTVKLWSTWTGDISGEMFEDIEILQRGPCGGGPASAPTVQRAWGTFSGEMWDGEQMHSGTCKTFWKGGYDWAEDGITLTGTGRQTLHACTGGLKGAHADLDVEWIPGGESTSYSGRAFFSSAP